MANEPPRRTGTASATASAPRQSGGGNSSAGSATSHGTSARKQTVLELLGLPCIPLAALAAYEQRSYGEDSKQVSPYALDIYAIQMHSEGLADSVVDLCESYPVLGAVIDKIGATTPFMAITASVIAIGTQLAENHGRLPDSMRGVSPALIPREDLARIVWTDAETRSNGLSDETKVMA